MTTLIPLARPTLGEEEKRALAEVIDSGQLVMGSQVALFEQEIAEFVGIPHAVAVSSGTSALYLALKAVGIKPGDEVIVPDLTWPSPAHAVIECGATPVLVDVDGRYWTLDLEQVERAINNRTRGIIAIDQFGVPADIPAIKTFAGSIPVIEDAACAIGSTIGSRHCGAQADLVCLSFHPRKLLTTGEGGMCLGNDRDLLMKVRQLSNHGQRSPGVFEISSGNYRLSELAAALGRVQLKKIPALVQRRRQLAACYQQRLQGGLWQECPEGFQNNYQTFGFIPEGNHWSFERAQQVIQQLGNQGIQVGRLSYALHQLPHLREHVLASNPGGFARSQQIAQGIALPLYAAMSEDQVAQVASAVLQACKQR